MAKFYRKVLKNGMTVIFEKRKNQVVSVAFGVRYGGIYEDINEKGISHFIEHMLYKGTTKRNYLQISSEIEKKGGILNGFTSEQVTAYWCKMPSKHLKTALDVLSDLIKNSLFDEKEIEKERNVILEEIKMRKDTPQAYVHDKIQNCLYKGSLGMDLIGTEKSLKNINKKKMIKKFEEVYTTNNLILCVVGDTEFRDICEFAEENFDKTKNKIPKPKVIPQSKTLIEKRKGVDQINLVLAYHVPDATKKTGYAAQILNTLMAGGLSSRLFQEIREKRNLAYGIKGYCSIDKDFGYNSIYVGCAKQNMERVKALILKEFKKIKNLKEKELEEIKEELIGNNKISREDSQGQMMELLMAEIAGKAKESYDYEKNIRKVKLSEVKKLANFKKYGFFALVPA